MGFAVECAELLLTWMKMSIDEAKQFVEDRGPYYSDGVETVEIPSLAPGERDPIFPAMKGFM